MLPRSRCDHRSPHHANGPLRLWQWYDRSAERTGEPQSFIASEVCRGGSGFESRKPFLGNPLREFTGLLKDQGIQISMDGKGCWRDNVFVERLWKSIKYEEVYLHAYETVGAAHQGLARYRCSTTRPDRIRRLTARRLTRCTMTI